ncbi:DUF4846 domain-containing protein [Romboutsia sp.]|uniref:DUF4846 domain-containing protein n=1 Tax=Romboutsia sp. TaxID=1965302 RepID=UPI003F358277
MNKLTIIIIGSILVGTMFVGCTSTDTKGESNKIHSYKKENINEVIIVNKEKNTIKERYEAPKGFTRVEVDNNSFEEYLRTYELKPYGEKVKYYNGSNKNKSGVYDSVFKVDIGDRDLHQCADAIMLLKAEYLYKNKRYDEISFNFVDGFKASYSKWLEGYRINVSDSGSSWYEKTGYDDSYENFRSYMNMVFAYSGTLSLDKEAEGINFDDMKIGDIFIVGGSPGHAVIVVDMAKNKESGETLFMLAQSYMPAQETQLLINPNNNKISPWYSTSFDGKLRTPEWTFEKSNLKRII